MTRIVCIGGVYFNGRKQDLVFRKAVRCRLCAAFVLGLLKESEASPAVSVCQKMLHMGAA